LGRGDSSGRSLDRYGRMPNYLARIPGSAQPVRVLRQQHRGSDNARTAQTVQRMREHIALAAGSPIVVDAIASATVGLARNSPPLDIVEAVFAWIKRNVTFQNDPPQDELLIDPRVLLALPRGQRKGDCDDFTMLGAAMLATLGFTSRIVTIKADQRDPTRWSHVYLEVELPDGRRMAFDASHGLEVGWEAPDNYGLQRWGGTMLLGSLAAGESWQQQLLSTGLTFADRIGQAYAQRVAVPVGTVIQTPEGMIARGPSTSAVGPILPQISLGGGQDIVPWILIIGGVIVLGTVLSRR